MARCQTGDKSLAEPIMTLSSVMLYGITRSHLALAHVLNLSLGNMEMYTFAFSLFIYIQVNLVEIASDGR